MVSTRNHPKNFPPPDLSPSKSPPSAASKSPSPRSPSGSAATPSASSTATTRRRSSRKGSWAHAPTPLTVLWLLVSLPLVAWDTVYIFLRPHSMPGGKYHWPVYSPYALYGSVDLIYGFPAWDGRNGFTAAQGALNVVESAMYVAYLVLVLTRGEYVGGTGRRSGGASKKGLFAARVVDGKEGALAVLLGLSAAVMTLSKTVLYWANEAFSGFGGVGHNDMTRLVFVWIIPNGFWLIFPTYMIYLFWNEILEGLAIASGDTKTSLLAIKDE